ncbi:MAG: AraC family transcriptional regulator [Clostridia bacterium]|nr:AraC family transcriptional regulator [Clostridia bacterium]
MILECFYHEKGGDKLTNKKHCHENCYEIIQTLSNNGHFVIKDSLYPIEHGSVFLINAIDLHYSAPENLHQYTRNKISLNCTILCTLAELLGFSSMIQSMFIDTSCAVISLGLNEIDRVDSLFHDIVSIFQNGDEQNQLGLYAQVFQLLQICFNNHKEKKPKIDNCVSQALTYINDHITTDISLDQLSTALFINKSYLCRQFKKATNMTIIEYIKNRRLSIAKKKLQFTNIPISDIALLCGFSTFSHFSNFFKKVEGMTPSKYREKYKNK